jgi:tetratricopeptide (TPR) repeat protein
MIDSMYNARTITTGAVMGRIEKTVFISYRRTNSFMARAVFQSLTARGYDVFFDYEGINSGDFEQIILGNLRARAHFLVILTPSALERCNEPGDWLRREIEMAIDEKRNIVPLFFEGFNFESPSIGQYLTGKMARLKSYNGLNVPSDYFNEAMDKLTNRFLNTPLDGVLHPLSKEARKGADSQKAAVKKTEKVTENELSAEEWFEKGYKTTDPDEQIHCYSEAIRLKPDYAESYHNRGVARKANNDLQGALADYDKAILHKPDLVVSYIGRGITRRANNDLQGALTDFNKAIRLDPSVGTARVSLVSILRKLNRTAEAEQQEKLARELIDKENEYNQACFEAICGNVERALELLKIAMDKGQSGREWARQDPDFESIRDNPRFQEIVGA